MNLLPRVHSIEENRPYCCERCGRPGFVNDWRPHCAIVNGLCIYCFEAEVLSEGEVDSLLA